MPTLAVTFSVETITPYADRDTPESIEATRSQRIDGFLTLETVSGHNQLTATDSEGNRLDSSRLALVYPRAETTQEALEAMVAGFPSEFIVGTQPED